MDIRFLAWAGYQFAQTGGGQSFRGCAPDFYGEDIGETQISANDIAKTPKVLGKDMRPTLVAFPPPTA